MGHCNSVLFWDYKQKFESPEKELRGFLELLMFEFPSQLDFFGRNLYCLCGTSVVTGQLLPSAQDRIWIQYGRYLRYQAAPRFCARWPAASGCGSAQVAMTRPWPQGHTNILIRDIYTAMKYKYLFWIFEFWCVIVFRMGMLICPGKNIPIVRIIWATDKIIFW